PVGAPPRCDWAVPATLRRRWAFAPGAGAPTANIRLPCALRRSTALGAIGTCRQLRRRRRVFAPGAGAPTANIRLPCALRRSTALGAIGAYRQLRRRRRAFAPGAGAPTTEFARRSTASVRLGRAGNSGAAGGYSHPGRVLLQRSLPVGAPPRCDWACRQLRRRRRVFAPGAGAPTGWGGRFDCRSTALGAIGAYRQLRRRRRGFAPGTGAPTGVANGPVVTGP